MGSFCDLENGNFLWWYFVMKNMGSFWWGSFVKRQIGSFWWGILLRNNSMFLMEVLSDEEKRDFLQPGLLSRLDCNRQFCVCVCVSVALFTAIAQLTDKMAGNECMYKKSSNSEGKIYLLVVFLCFLGSQEEDFSVPQSLPLKYRTTWCPLNKRSPLSVKGAALSAKVWDSEKN